MRVTVVGNAVVFELGITHDELKTVAKYDSEALVIREEDGSPKFMIGAKGAPGINSCGASFERGNGGKAQITILMEHPTKETVADRFGCAIASIAQIEAGLPVALEKAKAFRKSVEDAIVIG